MAAVTIFKSECVSYPTPRFPDSHLYGDCFLKEILKLLCFHVSSSPLDIYNNMHLLVFIFAVIFE